MIVEPKYFTLFALELMEYFCKHSELTEVAINDIYSVESELRELFGVKESGFNFSFSTISKLIPSLETVLLSGLKLETMEKDGEDHIECIRKWIENPENENLHRISFRSENIGGPQDPALVSLVEKYRKEFAEMGWALRYNFKNEDYHHILAQRMEKPIIIKLESKKMWKPKNTNVAKVEDEFVQSNTYELKVDGAAEFVDNLDEKRKMEFALSTVQSTLDAVLKNQAELRAIIEGIHREKNVIQYRLVAEDEVQLKEATENIENATLEVDHVEFESKVFPIKSNTVSNEEKSLEEMIKAQEQELIEKEQAEVEMKRTVREAQLRADRDRLERERMEFELKKREDAHREEKLTTMAAMKQKQREIEVMEKRMKEQQRKMREEKERREKEEAERLAEEQRVKMEMLRKKVTRVDALKQSLMVEEQVDEKEVDILSEIISGNAYDSDTLLLSEKWMTSKSSPWDKVSCARFVAEFLRKREGTFSIQLMICSFFMLTQFVLTSVRLLQNSH